MINTEKIFYYLFLLWVVLLIVFNINATITFGHGLGDIYYLLLLFFITISISLVRVRQLKKGNKTGMVILLMSFVIVIIFFMLKLTLYRGPEYPWNGRLFL